jgi:hypothetical protein
LPNLQIIPMFINIKMSWQCNCFAMDFCCISKCLKTHCSWRPWSFVIPSNWCLVLMQLTNTNNFFYELAILGGLSSSFCFQRWNDFCFTSTHLQLQTHLCLCPFQMIWKSLGTSTHVPLKFFKELFKHVFSIHLAIQMITPF